MLIEYHIILGKCIHNSNQKMSCCHEFSKPVLQTFLDTIYFIVELKNSIILLLYRYPRICFVNTILCDIQIKILSIDKSTSIERKNALKSIKSSQRKFFSINI